MPRAVEDGKKIRTCSSRKEVPKVFQVPAQIRAQAPISEFGVVVFIDIGDTASNRLF